MMDSRVPTIVQNVLDEYISLCNERIPHTLEGLYLHGSLALNAYLPHSSDIDFVAVTNRHLSEIDVETLSQIHQTLASKYPKPGMDGYYLQWEELGQIQTGNKTYPYYNQGEMTSSSGEHNAIACWILKTKGINILGPEKTTLHFDVHPQDLIDYVHTNMNTYWLSQMKSMEKLLILPNEIVDGAIEWCILGMLRQYYTLKEHDIISKVEAGEYALQHLSERWHKIIKEAIRIRIGGEMQSYSSKEQRIHDTIECMEYILNYCNDIRRVDSP